MRRSRALVAGLALAALAAALLRRIAFRPRERAELQFEDGSTITLAGSPQVDEFAAHARAALASR
jgi:ferric-dicitrate binding protein FerR (iron transport regulator)